ncbi:unnamed protein product [Rotaria magnacalcarata]|uniref:Uncharacterized protein n=1 Tax=Rotaria magnacalcarata TaxID=392030 RepID=A0A816RD10_9BILA|nr:unnamed protein product [Rotaria magnacalcarata]
MCKNNGSDETQPLNNLDSQNNEEDVIENNPIGSHVIPRSAFIGYVKSFGHQAINESFVTPTIAMKVIDYVHLLFPGE